MNKFYPLALLVISVQSQAGPFAPAAGNSGSTAIEKNSPEFVAWATSWRNYQPGSDVDTGWKTPDKALGKALGDSYDIVALGNGGSITLSFNQPITNGSGYDFAVFENGISDTFLELAWVEVSSNGKDFYRFDSYSYTPSAVSAFGSIDPTNLYGLAGKYKQGYGTPFDLSELKNISGLDLNNIAYIRIKDIVGNGSERDKSKRKIYDPYKTIGSAGFDLEAIGVIHQSANRTVPLDAITSDFESLALATDSYWAGELDPSVPLYEESISHFSSGLATFTNLKTDWGGGATSWTGWAYANMTDQVTPGFENQYSAYPGQANSGDNFAVASVSTDGARINFSSAVEANGFYLTNTTYTALSMLDGDQFAKKFGGTSGNDEDWLKLTVIGLNGNEQTGTIEYYLADYRPTDNNQDYIVDTWEWLDLSSLGTVTALKFAMSSSDTGDFGMNTPAYFALDDLQVTAKPVLDCHAAKPSLTSLWPANKGFKSVSISGVTGPNPFAITIQAITQDEPLINKALKDTSSPDAKIVTPKATKKNPKVKQRALLRAERQGISKKAQAFSGNGRVYTIQYQADDGYESCEGKVTVQVPPTKTGTAVLDTEEYDSTQR
jgi:hypothetical protein